MKKYKINAAVVVQSCVIALSDSYAKRFSSSLEAVEGSSGFYKVVAPVTLKAGMVVDTDHGFTKSDINQVELISDDVKVDSVEIDLDQALEINPGEVLRVDASDSRKSGKKNKGR